MPPEGNRALEHLLPVAAHQRQCLPLSFGVQKGKNLQQDIGWQALDRALSSLHAVRVCLESASALLSASSTFAVLLTVLAHLSVATHCTQQSFIISVIAAVCERVVVLQRPKRVELLCIASLSKLYLASMRSWSPQAQTACCSRVPPGNTYLYASRSARSASCTRHNCIPANLHNERLIGCCNRRTRRPNLRLTGAARYLQKPP